MMSTSIHQIKPEMAHLLYSLQLSTPQLQEMAVEIQVQARKGLKELNPELPLKMLPSFVTQLPTGKEHGKFLAVDFGGTNVRVCLVSCHPEANSVSTYTLESEECKIPESVKTGTRNQLFTMLAHQIRKFCDTRSPPISESIPLGFTFSFPCDQHALDHGILTQWTKGFAIPGVENENVISLLQEALDALPGPSIQVVALVNDTVGTLIAHAYRNLSARIGIILGTGTNAAYIERSDRIPKLSNLKADHMLINCEWGNFTPHCLTTLDEALDRLSSNPGRQRYEKLISGMYLPELVRLGLHEASKYDVFPCSAALQNPGLFTTQELSEIEAQGLEYAKEILHRKGLVTSNTWNIAHSELLMDLTHHVSTRATQLVAAGINALVGLLDLPSETPVAVGIDGSVWLKYHGFKERVRNTLSKLTTASVVLEDAADGSSLGAALIAAMAKGK